MVFIDPAWDDFQLSKNIVNRALWFRCSDFGIEREAQIVRASLAADDPGRSQQHSALAAAD